mmetsp:Transcript_29492/g.74095  ORF Transcript_29492/g.74095 Transcript_29492/m.74095 type:complete len:265 (-) Transcript_29492:70-864(-)
MAGTSSRPKTPRGRSRRQPPAPCRYRSRRTRTARSTRRTPRRSLSPTSRTPPACTAAAIPTPLGPPTRGAGTYSPASPTPRDTGPPTADTRAPGSPTAAGHPGEGTGGRRGAAARWGAPRDPHASPSSSATRTNDAAPPWTPSPARRSCRCLPARTRAGPGRRRRGRSPPRCNTPARPCTCARKTGPSAAPTTAPPPSASAPSPPFQTRPHPCTPPGLPRAGTRRARRRAGGGSGAEVRGVCVVWDGGGCGGGRGGSGGRRRSR